eukprot:897181-Rhodomonas_salina.2
MYIVKNQPPVPLSESLLDHQLAGLGGVRVPDDVLQGQEAVPPRRGSAVQQRHAALHDHVAGGEEHVQSHDPAPQCEAVPVAVVRVQLPVLPEQRQTQRRGAPDVVPGPRDLHHDAGGLPSSTSAVSNAASSAASSSARKRICSGGGRGTSTSRRWRASSRAFSGRRLYRGASSFGMCRMFIMISYSGTDSLCCVITKTCM